MTAQTTPQPRDVRPEDAEALRDCLIWLGDGRFIEAGTMDVYDDVVLAFDASRHVRSAIPTIRALRDFLRWMDAGDRLRTIGPKNPYGVNIEFYSSDAPSAAACAEEMVRAYVDGD